MRLIHYTDSPDPIVPLSVEQSRDSDRFMIGKPLGLWFSVEGEDDWRQWCLSEGYMVERLAYEHEITLSDDADIMVVDTLDALDHFDREYAKQGSYPVNLNVDWPSVAERYQGIIIAPYQWARRLGKMLWYYGWDCASGCIWDASAIQSIKLIVPGVGGESQWMNSRA